VLAKGFRATWNLGTTRSRGRRTTASRGEYTPALCHAHAKWRAVGRDAVVQRRFSRVRVSKPPPIRLVHNAARHTVDLVCTELGDTSRP